MESGDSCSAATPPSPQIDRAQPPSSKTTSTTMQLADEADAIAIEAGPEVNFVYHGWMRRRNIPEDVTHVRIHSFTRAIKSGAFQAVRDGIFDFEYRTRLRNVILNEELGEIGKGAFNFCKSLEEIVIPNTVRVIKDYAFYVCSGLKRATLGDGLEEMGKGAFRHCESLQEIIIPNAVRAIKREAFHCCWSLTNVTLGSGLEEIGARAFGHCESLGEIVIPDNVRAIGHWAFDGCTGLTAVTLGSGLEEIGISAFGECASLEEIVIPPAVKEIHGTAFNGCTNLTKVRFCDEIEDFVSCDAMSDWWNQGVGKESLRTYCFFVRCGIPARFESLSKVSSWQATIQNMLRIIPTTIEDYDNDGLNEEVFGHHFDAIDVKLTVYENLLNEVPALFLKQFGLGESIALNILSYTDCEDGIETMQLANTAPAVALEEVPEFFVYHGREYQIIPTDVTHIRIHSSVRAIKKKTFYRAEQLRIVILNEELEEIGEEAFKWSNSLEEIIIPNAVRAIKTRAFHGCSSLTTVTLGSGLEEIGASESLGEIVIPNNIKEIDCTAFDGCTNLMRVKFGNEIEQFVLCNAMSDWWNQGVGKKSLRTYCFLVRCGIPARLAGLTKISSWQATIHNMLRIIPDIAAVDNEDSDDDDDDDDSDADNDEINDEGMDVHFDAINVRLTM